MVECAIKYIGSGYIVTNFYSRTESQKLKRKLFSLNGDLDVVSIDKIKLIFESCEKVIVLGLEENMDSNYFFLQLPI